MLFGIGAAITAIDYGGYGNTIATPVQSALILGGLTDDASILSKLGSKFPDNLHDSSLINSAIDKAARLNVRVDLENGIRGAVDDDAGFADYVRLSFYLFGHKLLSLYLFYFVVFVGSVALFIYTFRRRSDILAVLLCVCVAQVYVVGSLIVDPIHYAGSITDPRFLSTLGIVPALHVACTLLYRLSPSPSNIAGVIIQSIILMFVMSIRASIIWAAFGIIVLALIVAVQGFRAKMGITASMWSVAILLIVASLQTLYFSRSLHPVYHKNGELGYHGVWHALFYQLQGHPGWQKKYASAYHNSAGDSLPQAAARYYLMQHPSVDPDSLYLDPNHKDMKARVMELYVRKAFIDFFLHDPRFVAETILIYNVKGVARTLWDFLGSLLRNHSWTSVGLGFAMIFIAGVAMLMSEAHDQRLLMKGPMLVTGTFFISLLPNVLTVQGVLLMSDQCFLFLSVITVWILFLVTQAMRIGINWASEARLSNSVLPLLSRGRDGFFERCHPVTSKIFFKQRAIEGHVANVDGGHGRG